MLKPGTKVRIKTREEMLATGWIEVDECLKMPTKLPGRGYDSCDVVTPRMIDDFAGTIQAIESRYCQLDDGRYILQCGRDYYWSEGMFVVLDKPNKRNLPSWF